MKKFNPQKYVDSHSEMPIIIHVYNGVVDYVTTKNDQRYLILDQDELTENPQCPICWRKLDNYCCSNCQYDFTDVLKP